MPHRQLVYWVMLASALAACHNDAPVKSADLAGNSQVSSCGLSICSHQSAMPRLLTDSEIADLLSEPKPLPPDWRTKLSPKHQKSGGHLQVKLDVEGDNGHRFRVIVRVNPIMLADFSVCLQFVDRDGQDYMLTRFNGSSHQHTNHYEKQYGGAPVTFRSQCHIHIATERYQRMGGRDIEGYADVTTQYSTLTGAVTAFAGENGFYVVHQDEPGQKRMF